MWVAYISSGLDKYEYSTEFVGLFHEYVDAVEALISWLAKTERVLVDDIQRTDFETWYLQRPDHTSKERLDVLCTRFSDGFYRDGWNYTMLEVQPQ